MRRDGESRADQCLRLLTTVLVLLFPAACLVIDRSDSATLLLLGGIGLCVWIRNGFRSGLARADWLFVTVFAGFFLAGVLAFELGYQTDEGFRLLGRYLRLLFVLPVLLALRRYPPPAPVVWIGLGFGALMLGLDAVWESVAAHGFLRPDGDTNVAILFGDLATLTTFAFAAGYVYIDARLHRAGPWLVAGCVLMGLLGSFLSGTRGAWMAIPVLLILFLFCRHLLRPRVVLLGGAVIAMLFAILIYLPQTHIQQRIQMMIWQTWTYLSANQDTNRSSGTPQCLDDRDVLQTWIGLGAGKYAPGFSARIIQLTDGDVTTMAGADCVHRDAVYLENRSSEDALKVLPRYQRENLRSASARLLLKGAGEIGFLDSGMQVVDLHGFAPVMLTAPKHYGGEIAMLLHPGQALWVVPEESYFGEYRYPVFNTPVGQRLEMWRAALQLFASAPVFGVGLGAYQVETGKLVDAGLAAPGSARYDHPHSDFLDAMANRGFVGLLGLLLLLGVPAWLYARRLDSHDPHAMGAALGGLLVTVGYAIFGLTETLFIHSVTIGWYVMMTAMFLVSSTAPNGKGKDR